MHLKENDEDSRQTNRPEARMDLFPEERDQQQAIGQNQKGVVTRVALEQDDLRIQENQCRDQGSVRKIRSKQRQQGEKGKRTGKREEHP